jgi:hypothetical protein
VTHTAHRGAVLRRPGQALQAADIVGRIHRMPNQAFKGNKSALPSKPCMACGRPMSWRKAWAKNWAEVRYCSDRCRQAKPARPAA